MGTGSISLHLTNRGVEVIIDVKQEMGVAIDLTRQIDGMTFQGTEVRCIAHKWCSLMKVVYN